MKDDSSETRENHSSDLSSKRLCHEHGDDCPSENEREFESLEYEEDVYYSKLAATPSFDDIDELSVNEEIIMHCWKDSNCELDEIIVDDTDLAFVEGQEGTRRMRRSIRIIFQEFSKSYLEKFSRGQKKLMERLKGEDALHSGLNSGLNSPSMDNIANELAGMTPEQQEEQKEEWRRELAKVEEEIQTLRHVLSSKVRVSQELKRKLGITVWKDITDDVNQGIRNVKESQVYQNVGEKLGRFTRAVSENSLFQRTESVCKQAAGLTTSILGGFGSGITMKLGQMRNSDSFRSLEEKVGSAYENVKGKVTPSRSTSTQSFDEALREAEASRRASGAPSAATSPTIPEEKLLS
ncbi:tumor protein D54 isoform X1 [Fopius arisanus]|uniref:Tumor protein D54 isoform X1 n=1 Tax=Fopius arisanus TaxID=64838 RepID=A0A9R1T1P9_9HYME|nr:PREDICTED: tumor protein D54 isoform X1 [Fopius arisanus]